MKYCEACGYELESNMSVCPVCGTPAPVENASEASDAQQAAPVWYPDASAPQQQIPPSEMPTVMIRPEDAAAQQQIPPSEMSTVMIRPEDAAKHTQGNNPVGQYATGSAGTGNYPQAGNPSIPGSAGTGNYSQTGNPSIPGRGVPTGEMPTARVTLGDTGNLTENEKKGKSDANKNRSKNEQKKFAVKKRPKHLGLKIAILCGLLLGVGLGSFFVIRAMQGKQKRTAFYKTFTGADVEMDADNSLYVRNQLIIRGEKDATEKKISKLIQEKKAVIVGEIPISNEYQVEFDPGIGRSEMDDIIEEWEKSDLVASVRLHHAHGTAGGTFFEDNPWRDDNNPDDPSGSEWNIYQPDGNNWAVESVWAPKIWEGLEDESGKKEYAQVDVGLIDTTVDTTHKDLNDRFNALKQGGADPEGNAEGDKEGTTEGNTEGTVSGTTLIEGNPSSVVDDYSQYTGRYAAGNMDEAEQAEEKRLSHGTHTAGIISANLEDDFGIAGVAQNAKLYGYAAGSDASYQNGDYKEARSLTSSFAYKYTLSRMQENSIRLVNISMLLDPMVEDEAVRTRIMEDMNADMEYFLKACLEQNWDFLLIKSAGDDSTDQFNDAFLCGITDTAIRERIVVVGGAECDYQGGKLEGYKKTETTNYGERIDIYAPGPDVLSDIPGDRTEKRSGTSEATAFVTGGCALVMGILPTLSMPEVKDIVLNNYYYTVEDTGKGYLNLYMAVSAARARRDSSDASGIKDEMQKEINENNVPKEGTLELSLDPEFLAKIGDVSLIRGTAAQGSEKRDVTFDETGKSNVSLTEGEWKIQIEADDYEPKEIQVKIVAGEKSSEEGVVLAAMVKEISLDQIPEQDKLKAFLDGWGGKKYENDQTDNINLEWIAWHSDPDVTSLIKVEANNKNSDPLKRFTWDNMWKPGSRIGINAEGLLWVGTKVMNIAAEVMQKEMEDARDVSKEMYNSYEHNGYYYFCSTEGNSTATVYTDYNGEIREAKTDGEYYYITVAAHFKDSWGEGSEERNEILEYKLKLKEEDGVTFWSIYYCRTQ